MSDAFVHPGAWPALLLAPVGWLLLLLAERRRGRRLRDVLGPRAEHLAGESPHRRRGAGDAAAAAALALLVLALMQPLGDVGVQRAAPRGVDVMVCLDVSRSMRARDALPDRLLAARRAVAAWIERAGGDRIGLVAFAGEARLVAPLTTDHSSLRELLEATDELAVARGGTDLGAALDEALAALDRGGDGHEAIVLITDGDDRDGRGRVAAGRCAEAGVTVHCVGYGSALGSKIPMRGDDGEETFLRDVDGREVVSALDATALRAVAEAGGGTFVAAAEQPDPLSYLHDTRLRRMARKTFESEARLAREPLFQWPLLAALLLLLVDLGLPRRRRVR